MIGVLGGMGPLATADFFAKVIAATDAQDDAGHVPLLIHSDPRIPGRPAALLHGGSSPLPALLAARDRLITAGAQGLVMACNTAHDWYDELVQQGGLPILHIADAACKSFAGTAVKRVGLIATEGTVAAQFYQSRFAAHQLDCLLSSTHDQETLVLPAIECVKRNELAQAHALATPAARHLLDQGAQAIVLGCTEIPLAIDYQSSDVTVHCIDATRALARACVAWWRSNGH